MNTNIEALIKSAKSKEIRHRSHAPRPKSRLTNEELGIIKAMTKEDINYNAIFETLKEKKLTEYTSFPGWLTACKRVKALKQ